LLILETSAKGSVGSLIFPLTNIFVCWTYTTGLESTRKLRIPECGQARKEVIRCWKN